MNDEHIRYYKKRYAIAFYKEVDEGADERLVACFNNSVEICKYKNIEINQQNIQAINIQLCNAFKRLPHTTRMLDGSSMRVYLIDMLRDDDLEDRLEQERRDKCMATKKYVQINSSVTIEVYNSLEAIEVVTPENLKGDRLNARSGWAKISVLLETGTSWYPSEILAWNAIKDLAGKEIITIGAQSDEVKNDAVRAKADAQREKILKGMRDFKNQKEKLLGKEAKTEKVAVEEAA